MALASGFCVIDQKQLDSLTTAKKSASAESVAVLGFGAGFFSKRSSFSLGG